MAYRNYSRLVLAILAFAFLAATLIFGLTTVVTHTDSQGHTLWVSPWLASVAAIFFLSFVTTATGWLVLRGVNYDTWYRSTHGGQPLHVDAPDYSGVPADWKAAERSPDA
jgi:hypothetical protein